MSMLTHTPIVIAVAPNGARKTKEDHPNLPVTTDEIVSEAVDCQQAGATLLHLHVRKEDLSHCLDINRYKSTMRSIRDAVGENMIIQISTEACGVYTPEEQIRVVKSILPDSVSIALKEIIPDESHEEEVKEFLHFLAEENIQPQYVLYSAEDVLRFAKLVERGVIPGVKHVVLFVLGRYSKGYHSEPFDLLPFLAALHESGRASSVIWSVCAFGKLEAGCVLTAAALGGHVRVGFENNLHTVDGRIAQHNVTLVEQFVQYSNVTGRTIADIDSARQLMCLR